MDYFRDGFFLAGVFLAGAFFAAVFFDGAFFAFAAGAADFAGLAGLPLDRTGGVMMCAVI